MAGPKLGVPGLPGVGEETLSEGPTIMDPGRAKHDGDLPGPPGGSGEGDRGGGRGFEVRVSENIAWDREGCAFISISFVRRMEEPLRSRLGIGGKNWVTSRGGVEMGLKGRGTLAFGK